MLYDSSITPELRAAVIEAGGRPLIIEADSKLRRPPENAGSVHSRGVRPSTRAEVLLGAIDGGTQDFQDGL